MRTPKNERGQAIVLTVLFMAAVLGMAALVIDVGSWYHAKRQLQSTADAAALAGAQALPRYPANASAWALDYGSRNGGGVLAGDVTITRSWTPNDTISVKAKKSKPGIFSRVLGVGTVDIGASAKARVEAPAQARYVAPMVVNCAHDYIRGCNGDPSLRLNAQTTLPFNALGAPGAFGMLNLDGSNGTVGSSKEADWILKGFDRYLDLGDYRSDPGAKFSAQNVRGALDARIGTVLLFPVFKSLSGQGQNAVYDIIGWIGFHLTSYTNQGNNATLSGYFTEFITRGIQAGSASQTPTNFGAVTVQLIG